MPSADLTYSTELACLCVRKSSSHVSVTTVCIQGPAWGTLSYRQTRKAPSPKLIKYWQLNNIMSIKLFDPMVTVRMHLFNLSVFIAKLLWKKIIDQQIDISSVFRSLNCHIHVHCTHFYRKKSLSHVIELS